MHHPTPEEEEREAILAVKRRDWRAVARIAKEAQRRERLRDVPSNPFEND